MFMYFSRVTIQPSSRTSYVILGEDAGPSKLAAIKKHHLRTLDEDGFLNLIATRVPDGGDEKAKKKLEKEQEAIKQAARELSRRGKHGERFVHFRVILDRICSHLFPSASSGKLWTDKYAPQTLKEICGNKGQVEKLQGWLKDW